MPRTARASARAQSHQQPSPPMVPAQQPIGPSRQTLNPPAAMSLAPTVAAAATVPEAPVVQIVVPVYWQPSIQSYKKNFEVRHTLHAEITADTFEVMEVCQEKGTKEAKDMILNLAIQRPLLLINNGTEYINPPSKKNLPRYNDACVGFCFGEEATKPCKKCALDQGAFPICVTATVNGAKLWGGACTCCRLQSKEKQCSFYSNEASSRSAAAAVTAGGVGGVGGGNTGARVGGVVGGGHNPGNGNSGGGSAGQGNTSAGSGFVGEGTADVNGRYLGHSDFIAPPGYFEDEMWDSDFDPDVSESDSDASIPAVAH